MRKKYPILIAALIFTCTVCATFLLRSNVMAAPFDDYVYDPFKMMHRNPFAVLGVTASEEPLACIITEDKNVECGGDGYELYSYQGGDAVQVEYVGNNVMILNDDGNVLQNEPDERYIETESEYEGWSFAVEQNQDGDWVIIDNVVAIEAGYWEAYCLLRDNGNVTCPLGHNYNGENAPYYGQDAIAFAPGGYNNCILKNNHNVYCYGEYEYNYTGQDAMYISNSIQTACIIKTDGNGFCFEPDGTIISNYNGGDAISMKKIASVTSILREDGTYLEIPDNDSHFGQGWWVGSRNDIMTMDSVLDGYEVCLMDTDKDIECNGNTSLDITEDPLIPFFLVPSADFNASTLEGTESLTVNFTDNSSGSPTAWNWDFDNDGTVDSTSQNPSYTFTNNGLYTVKLTITAPGGTDTEIKKGYIVVKRANSGYIHMSSAGKGFVDDNGEQFIPIGFNAGGLVVKSYCNDPSTGREYVPNLGASGSRYIGGTPGTCTGDGGELPAATSTGLTYDEWFHQIGENGVNVVRVWFDANYYYPKLQAGPVGKIYLLDDERLLVIDGATEQEEIDHINSEEYQSTQIEIEDFLTNYPNCKYPNFNTTNCGSYATKLQSSLITRMLVEAEEHNVKVSPVLFSMQSVTDNWYKSLYNSNICWYDDATKCGPIDSIDDFWSNGNWNASLFSEDTVVNYAKQYVKFVVQVWGDTEAIWNWEV